MNPCKRKVVERQSEAANGQKKKCNQPKYRLLSLADKCTIIQRLEAGETNTDLAKEYGVAHSTISYIKKNQENISSQQTLLEDQQESRQRTRATATDTSPLEKGIYKWFCQKRTLGEPVSGPMLREKARLYNEKLGGPSEFQASNGWIHRFKIRHGIRELSMKGEKFSGDVRASSAFVTDLNKIIEEGNYELDNIYNADETGLAWKSLPQKKTLAARRGKEVAGRKVLKDRVTVMACGNASGTHRIPLLVIGKSQIPRCFKNVKELPIDYRGQCSAWIDKQIFSDWYKSIFLPAIKRKNNGNSEKFLLLLDNAPSHPSAEDLNSIDKSCRVIFLPPNQNALIQPMDQGVIEATKKYYKKSLLRKLLLEEEVQEGDTVSRFLKNWNILNCCEAIAQAWDHLSDATLRNAWKKILSPDKMNAEVEVVKDCELTHLINRIPGYDNFTDEETAAWLEEDSLQPVWHILADNQILNLDEPAESSIHAELGDVQEDDDDDCGSPEDLPMPREVLKSLDTVLRWYRSRWESEAEHVSSLHKIRQLAEDVVLEQ